jgi:FtsP/CotA-like multicopper oxidase with cupredoxin domain
MGLISPAIRLSLLAALMWVGQTAMAAAPEAAAEVCPRPAAGGVVEEPEDLRSENGVLKAELTVRNEKSKDGSMRFCYLLADGGQSPTLRLNPGDLLILSLKNSLADVEGSANEAHAHPRPKGAPDPCKSGVMTITSANLHFHGLSIPALCHQDEVLQTSIQPNAPSFEYRFRIPDNEPPGLYWYHPHIHGFSSRQVLGGASGALIVEGLERATPEIAGLPERVLVIRDQDLLNPDASPRRRSPRHKLSSIGTATRATMAPVGENPRRTCRSISCRCRIRSTRARPSMYAPTNDSSGACSTLRR